MKRPLAFKTWLNTLLNPAPSAALDAELERQRDSVPLLWLLGKSGAGKTSIVQRLTGDSRAEIGSGYAPCTTHSKVYDHPATLPVMRFLDTRGLGEAGYDPSEDIAYARQRAHAVLVLSRVDDTAQKPIADVLASVKDASLPVLHIHTALHARQGDDQRRAMAHNHDAFRTALEREIPAVHIDFTQPDDALPDPDHGLAELQHAIVALVPQLALALEARGRDDAENTVFSTVRGDVLGHSGAAAGIDLFPAVGLFAVPAIQGRMLQVLAGRYRIEWNRSSGMQFLAALGTSFLYRYAVSLGLRQLGKLIPVYGQSAGAAAAAALSFAATYALGRTAAFYFFKQHHGVAVDTEQLQALFRQSFSEQLRHRRQAGSV